MPPADDQVKATTGASANANADTTDHATATTLITDSITLEPASMEAVVSERTLDEATDTASANNNNNNDSDVNSNSDDFSDIQARQLKELSQLHRLSDSDLEGYITSNETATGHLSVLQLIRLLSAGYDRACQSVEEKQHELVTLHAEFARQQERLWQLDRSVASLQRQISLRKSSQPVTRTSTATTSNGSNKNQQQHKIPQITVKQVTSNSHPIPRIQQDGKEDIDATSGNMDISQYSEEEDVEQLPFDDPDTDDGQQQQQHQLLAHSRKSPTHQLSKMREDAAQLFLGSYKLWKPRRARRRSSFNRHVHKRDNRLYAPTDEFDSDLDAEDTTWFSCGSPASSGDEQSSMTAATTSRAMSSMAGITTTTNTTTNTTTIPVGVGSINLGGSLSSGAIPRRPHFNGDDMLTRRSTFSSMARPHSMVSPGIVEDDEQALLHQSNKVKGKGEDGMLMVEHEKLPSNTSPRIRSSIEKWTAGLLTWRMSTNSSALTTHTEDLEEHLLAHSNNEVSTYPLATMSEPSGSKEKAAITQHESSTTSSKDDHTTRSNTITATTVAKGTIAAPSRSRSPVSGHFSLSAQSTSASPQLATASMLSTAAAAAAQQLAITGRLNLPKKSVATTQEQRPTSIVSNVSTDHELMPAVAVKPSTSRHQNKEGNGSSPSIADREERTSESAPGVPLHFKAIAIAAKLISGGQLNSAEIYSNSKRGIARWTVGLLAHQPFARYSEDSTTASFPSRKSSTASTATSTSIAMTTSESSLKSHTLTGYTNVNEASTSTTDAPLSRQSTRTSSSTIGSRRRTPPTALPLISGGSMASTSGELSGLSPATTSFTSAHAITTPMGIVLDGKDNRDADSITATITATTSGNTTSSNHSASNTGSIDLSMTSPPRSPGVARNLSLGTLATFSSSNNGNQLHCSLPSGRSTGAAHGLLAQLAEQHDTIQDAIMERWSRFAHGPDADQSTTNTATNTAMGTVTEEAESSSEIDKKMNVVDDYLTCVASSKRNSLGSIASPQSSIDTSQITSNTDDKSSLKSTDILDNDATIRVKGSVALAPFASMPTTPIQHSVMENLPEGILARRIQNKTKKELKELRHLVRAGVPAQLRPQVWLECSGAYNIRQSGYYQRLLDTNTDKSSTFMTQIELDVHRTMPDNIFFGGDGPGVCKLRRVLTAYSWHNPTIGYCQGMNVMAATLLLVFPTSEENAFWTLVYLMEHIIPEGYHSHQLMVAQADQRVLEELCRDTAPQLAGHLKACGVDMAAITISWFLSIFAESMPLETLLRVWDMVLVEGFLALFRISVALFHLHERDMLKLHSTTSLYVYLKSAPAHTRRPERLLQLAFGRLKSSIRNELLQTRRAHHIQALREEYACMSY